MADINRDLYYFKRRVNVLRSLITRISEIDDVDLKLKFSKLVGGLCMFLSNELGDDIDKLIKNI